MVETRAESLAAIEKIAACAPAGLNIYVEVPVDDEELLRKLVAALSENRLRAKIRTGGVTPGDFPGPEAVAHFIRCCYTRALPFKATAGLHHAIRAEQALTYEADAPRADMFGFLNVFLTAAFCYNGIGAVDSVRCVQTQDAEEFVFEQGVVRWGDYVLTAQELSAIRRRFAISFGSCSFQEPVEDLRNLKLL